MVDVPPGLGTERPSISSRTAPMAVRRTGKCLLSSRPIIQRISSGSDSFPADAVPTCLPSLSTEIRSAIR